MAAVSIIAFCFLNRNFIQGLQRLKCMTLRSLKDYYEGLQIFSYFIVKCPKKIVELQEQGQLFRGAAGNKNETKGHKNQLGEVLNSFHFIRNNLK